MQAVFSSRAYLHFSLPPAHPNRKRKKTSFLRLRLPLRLIHPAGMLIRAARECSTAAVNDDNIDADQLEQHHVVREALLEPFVDHGVAAVLDDDGRPLAFRELRLLYAVMRYRNPGRHARRMTRLTLANITE